MKSYWEKHAINFGSTVKGMMLDANADQFSNFERSEILSLLPSIKNTDILELGAGIGRFTTLLGEQAKSVHAVDFIQEFIDKNKEVNQHNKNITFDCLDARNADFPENSFDFVFTNWLMMYLSDKDVKEFTDKVKKWLRPGGYFFFRESCNHQSGKRDWDTVNPTIYRTKEQYTDLIVGEDKESSDWKIIFTNHVKIYEKLKDNKNQII